MSAIQAGGAAGGLPFVSFVVRSLQDLLHLDQNADALSMEMEDLEDLRQEVDWAAQTSGRLTGQARAWMDAVDCLVYEVAGFRGAFGRSGTGCLCCSWSCYKHAIRAADMLRRARGLKVRSGDLGAPVGGALPDPFLIVGRGRTLSDIRDYLKCDHVCVIGIYGIGGVGKTTLLRRINNQCSACAFDVVIWVTVTRTPNIQKIQDDVGTQLGLHLSSSVNWRRYSPENVYERAQILFKALMRKEFLLLLDDLWGALDLEAVGIPHPTYRRYSKILFTSRSSEVCRDMAADVQVKVSILNMEESWKLFRRSVGAEVDLMSPLINPLAKDAAERCGGLPLALITVGRALSHAQTVKDWESAMELFRESPARFQDMKRVPFTLKFSYERLQDESSRECLLYCSLFPEGHNIHVEELIDYWIGEGLLDFAGSPDDIDAARSRGHFVIARLKAAYLLEGIAGEDGYMYVKMHNAVHDMALWLSAEGNRRFHILSGWKDFCLSDVYRRPDVFRISLMDSEIGDFSELPYCPQLVTLFLNRNTCLDHIPATFFNSMPILRVLDLSSTKIKGLPEEIGLLIELRYLNLSHTIIRSLPIHIGKLLKLEQLDLRYTVELVTIPQGAILSLTNLQKLNLYNSAYCWTSESKDDGEREVSLKDLKVLGRLNDVRLDVKSLLILGEILSCNNLSRSIRYLTLQHMENMRHLPPEFNAMNKLRDLCIDECSDLRELAFCNGQLYSLEVLSLIHLSITKIVIMETALHSLRHLRIFDCQTLKNLTSIHQLPHLQYIELHFCNEVEVLISAPVDEDFAVFPQLRKISLCALPNFKGICWHPMFLPRLECVIVFGCPMFMKLPLDSHSARNIKQILGRRKWWDTLQWDDESTKLQFLPYFKDPWVEEQEEEEEEEEVVVEEDIIKRRKEQLGGGDCSGETNI